MNNMKNSSIKLPEDVVLSLNQLKYKWQMETQAQVIRRLIEIGSAITRADLYKTEGARK